jgi:hypothetical protein
MLWNMWLIIISLTLVSLYGYLYSQAIFFTPRGDSESCRFPSLGIFVYNFNNIVERFVTYVFWTLPIVYQFWPPDRTWYGGIKDVKRRASSTNSTSNKTYMPLNAGVQNKSQSVTGRLSVNQADSDSSSSDDDYRSNRVSSAANKLPMMYSGRS